MGLLSRLNPAAGAADFLSEFRRPNPYRWPILGVSMAISFGLIYLFTHETVTGPPIRPNVTYITSFEPGRSDEQIIASNVENQRKKDERAARIAAAEERKKELYRALARASGMDPDEIERKAAAERAAEESAEAARRNQILSETVETAAE